MTLRKSLLLLLSLGMISALVACSSSSSSTPPPTVSIAATSGSGQTALVATAFAAPLVATVTTDGTPTAGVAVTFTAPASGASGTFSGGTTTETDTTDSNGVATSSALTANSTTGAYAVTASATGASGSASFNLTNHGSPVLAAGNYVYYVSGTDTGTAADGFSSPYIVAGVFTTDGNGNITGGEQDFSDFNYFSQADAITGGSLAASTAVGDTNLTITLNTADTGIGPGASTGTGSGTIVLNASMASTTKGLLTEYDSWATGSGYLDLQTSTAALCPAAPGTACGYAFAVNGLDLSGYASAVGGVITIDLAGGISGTGSVFDVNDECDFLTSSTTSCSAATYSGQSFGASTVSAPDSLGFVQFTLNSNLYSNTSGFAGMVLDGYMIDANHIRIVENWLDDWYAGTTGGLAVAQTGTGAFASSSVSGSSYVFGMSGYDSMGVLQNAGVLTFNSDGTVSGTLSFNDLATQTPQGGTAGAGTYTVDSTGRVSIFNLTDNATFGYNFELYLSGGSEAVMISMDVTNTSPGTSDVLGGLSWQQGTGAFDLTTVTGDYAVAFDQYGVDPATSTEAEWDSVGLLTSDGAGNLGGYFDQNLSLFVGGGLVPDNAFSAALATTSTNSVYTVTPNSDTYTSYIVDGTAGVVLEDDSNGLTLGYFANQ
jgi:hypothetical protein